MTLKAFAIFPVRPVADDQPPTPGKILKNRIPGKLSSQGLS
jgi:hypothetical protein